MKTPSKNWKFSTQGMMLGRFWIIFGSFGMWKLLRDEYSIYLWEIYTPFIRATWLRK